MATTLRQISGEGSRLHPQPESRVVIVYVVVIDLRHLQLEQAKLKPTVPCITLTTLLTAFREYGGAFGDRVSMRAGPIYASRWKKFLTRDKRSCCSIATW